MYSGSGSLDSKDPVGNSEVLWVVKISTIHNNASFVLIITIWKQKYVK